MEDRKQMLAQDVVALHRLVCSIAAGKLLDGQAQATSKYVLSRLKSPILQHSACLYEEA